MAKTIGLGTITLTNLNDAKISSSAPKEPERGDIWIDSSGGKNILKEWDGNQWINASLDVSELDKDLSEKITNIEESLGTIGLDGVLTYSERIELTKELNKVIGETLSTSITIKYPDALPDYTVVDANASGSFSTYRYNAREAGVDTDSAVYNNLQKAYTDMINYLAKFDPKPWDIRKSKQDEVTELDDGDTLREHLLDYYLAELALVNATTNYANEKINEVTLKDRDRKTGTELFTEEASDDSVVHVEVDGRSYQRAGDGKNKYNTTNVDNQVGKDEDSLDLSPSNGSFYYIDGENNKQYTLTIEYSLEEDDPPKYLKFYYDDGIDDGKSQGELRKGTPTFNFKWIKGSSPNLTREFWYRKTITSEPNKTVVAIGVEEEYVPPYEIPLNIGFRWDKSSKTDLTRTSYALPVIGFQWDKTADSKLDRVGGDVGMLELAPILGFEWDKSSNSSLDRLGDYTGMLDR